MFFSEEVRMGKLSPFFNFYQRFSPCLIENSDSGKPTIEEYRGLCIDKGIEMIGTRVMLFLE